ncbi:MAG: VWA domain-containing protein [Acidobacteriaceae bacterium]|nr:VWA domain-containing protein [Acidobacteriaceae bacterium]
MTFAYPLFLILLLLPVVWVIRFWRRKTGRVSLLLKAASLVAVIFALAEPVVTFPQTKTAAAVLVDTSGSISQSDLSQADHLAAQIAGSRGGNWMKVVPFARVPRPLSQKEIADGFHLVPAANEYGLATNLEAALTSSVAAMPAGYIPRLVLISDGKENEGSSVRAIAELQRFHVPVDTIPLSGRPTSELHLQSISMPREAYAGEPIPIDLAVFSPEERHAQVEISAEGKKLGTDAIDLQSGVNLVRVHARVNSSGVASISGRIEARPLGDVPFEVAIQLKRAKVLYLSQDPPGSDTNLLSALSQADFDLSRDVSQLEKDLSNFQLVILNNLDLSAFTPAQKNRLEQYVKEGGGLILIGGERQVYKEERQMDALDRALPAKLAPPKTPEGICVGLIVDKSSSMEGRKIDLARLSAIGVVDHLRPIDYIGVLIFDNSFQWAVPVRRAEDKSLIKRLISGITPDGGTQIAPALAEAYRRVLPSKASVKHIVLLTDGISEEGDSLELAKEALAHQVTISTVGLGQDVNRTYLEKIAANSGGRSYFLNEPAGLEQILLKDVQDYSGSTAVERPLTPLVAHGAEILDGIGINAAPPLKGYARFTAKPAADTILSIDEVKKDPLYVQWQYGLGRAAVFTSDAKSRWAESWIGWPGFDKFWINVTRNLLSHSDRSEGIAHFDAANDSIEVTYHLSAETPEPASVPPIFVLGPNGFEKPITVAKTGPRVYRGTLHTGNLHGLFRIRPVVETSAFPEVGLYRQEQELQDRGSDTRLLKQISSFTGGRFNPAPSSIFDSDGRKLYTHLQLWPALLGGAILLTIAELIVRKWSGLTSRFRRV